METDPPRLDPAAADGAVGEHGEQRIEVSPGDLPENRGVSADGERPAGGERRRRMRRRRCMCLMLKRKRLTFCLKLHSPLLKYSQQHKVFSLVHKLLCVLLGCPMIDQL